MTAALYRYRWLLYELVVRDLVLRYRGSILGFVWTLLNPLLFMAVYTLVFSVYLRLGMPHFALFLVAGIVPWMWFNSAVLAGTSSIVDGRMYIGKTVFEPMVLVVVPILSNFVNYLFMLPMLVIIAALFHVVVGAPVLVLPVLIGIQFVLTLAILLFIATFNVFFRDLQQLVGIVLMLVFYLTPIFYPITAVPQQFRAYVMASPVAPIILAYQDIFYFNRFPDPMPLLYSLVVSILLLIIGLSVFNRYKDAFADYL